MIALGAIIIRLLDKAARFQAVYIHAEMLQCGLTPNGSSNYNAGDEPFRIEDSETHAAYLIVREGVCSRMLALTVSDHSDRSLYEFGEFQPKHFSEERDAPRHAYCRSC